LRPVQVVFDVTGLLPGYDEVDVSATFLLFLSLFFAMIVGDAGYGLVFLILTLAARRALRAAPPEPFRLLGIMSACTIVWGVLTGNVFGMTRLPGVVSAARIDWLRDERNVMLLCFLIGAVHLTVAHAWNAVRSIRTPQVLAQLGWICTTWTMFFVARDFVLGEPMPRQIVPLFVAGVAAVVLFMTPVRALKSEWPGHVMLPLTLVSNFVDLVSYVRLFAVGTAGFAVAASFNEMALEGSRGGLLAAVLWAVILFFGHALNLLLAAMGVLVHGVRLNTLEFSSHIGMQWTGIPYRPFASHAHAGPGSPDQERT
jgi:V/A-type H+-transporting ATPase subunit I